MNTIWGLGDVIAPKWVLSTSLLVFEMRKEKGETVIPIQMKKNIRKCILWPVIQIIWWFFWSLQAVLRISRWKRKWFQKYLNSREKNKRAARKLAHFKRNFRSNMKTNRTKRYRDAGRFSGWGSRSRLQFAVFLIEMDFLRTWKLKFHAWNFRIRYSNWNFLHSNTRASSE